jgi:hypothetical protein
MVVRIEFLIDPGSSEAEERTEGKSLTNEIVSTELCIEDAVA